MSHFRLTTAAALALLAGASNVTAQDGAYIGLAGGYVEHAVAGGTSGTGFGADASFQTDGTAVRLGYRRMLLEGNAPDTDALRATIRYPALEMAGMLASAEIHGGVARFARDDDSGLVLAGGLGIHLAPAGSTPLRPFLSVRGLGGYATGTVLGESYTGDGLALGVEGGIQVLLGPAILTLTGSRDGFDGGLGATPYPRTTAELSIGVRF